MSDMHRGSAYANDPAYDTLQARHVRTTERIGYTLDGWLVKQTITVMDFGKPSRDVADPDVMIDAQERIPHVPAHPRPSRTPGTPNNSKMQQLVVDYLTEFGPSFTSVIGDDLGMSQQALWKHIKRREGYVYHCVERRGMAKMWGLVDNA